jgi:Family of unknown function (DUF6152)
MISTTRATVLVVALLTLSPLAVEAHHAASMFEAEKETTVTGVVKEFQYTNPHSWLLVDVMNKDGSVTTWGFEAEGPGVLMRNGIRKSDFAPGTKLTITGHPMKNGQPAASWIKAVRGDGVEFNPRLRPSNDTPAPAGNDAAAPPASSSAAPTR